ncbi:MAG: penicillin-binding protein activator [Gammaproteobacteria bacterium]
MLLLAACGVTPPEPQEDIRAQLSRSASALERQGNYAGAADIWRQAAVNNPGRRQEFEAAAARTYYRGGQTAQATEILNKLLAEQLPAGLMVDVRLLTALLGNDTGQFKVALDALSGLPGNLTPTQRLQVSNQRLRSLDGLKDTQGLVRELSARSSLMSTPDALRANQERLWAALSTLNNAQLEKMLSETTDQGLQGWLDLALVGKRFGLNPEALRSAAVDWQTRYPAHPAAGTYLNELISRMEAPATHPKRIAVLLPLSGSLSVLGQAVRDGIMAAYLQLQPVTLRPELEFVDTAKTDALTAYLNKLDGGTDAILGPLTKESLTKVAVSGEIPIPVLGLNRLPKTIFAPENLYQFGLAPEDDAVGVAERGLSESYQRALVLVPDSDWGRRVSTAFSQAFEDGGGQTLAVESFGEKMTDFGAPLKALLGLEESDQRYRNVAAIIGAKMEFEPRRRQDTDFIFLAANPRQARLIRPLLQFHHAGDIPLYASSHVYTGIIDAQADKDMNGLEFADIPWIIGNGRFAAQRTRMETQWPGSSRQARLQALGFDAFGVLPLLGRLKSAAGETVEGATGSVYADSNGVIHRRPIWARFDQGTARLIQPLTTTTDMAKVGNPDG